MRCKNCGWEIEKDYIVCGKCGFIDKTGKEVIPCQWSKAGTFSDGIAPVKDDNGKYRYIDKTGRIVG